jgi:hypothetical protein
MMKALLLLPLFIMLVLPGQSGTVATDGSAIAVLSFKWTKQRQTIVHPDNENPVPAKSAMLPANRILERNRKVNEQAGVRDPNADTVEGRSAALEKSVQEARSPKSTPVDGFLYQVKLRNANTKAIEVLFWEYQFVERSNPSNVVSRQFLCGVNIKPDKEKELKVFSTHSPSNLISVGSLTDKSGNLFEEKVLINRVEYTDGSIWQRKEWNYADVKQAIARALETPWGLEMCRSL